VKQKKKRKKKEKKSNKVPCARSIKSDLTTPPRKVEMSGKGKNCEQKGTGSVAKKLKLKGANPHNSQKKRYPTPQHQGESGGGNQPQSVK